jgi:hypothetical protein
MGVPEVITPLAAVQPFVAYGVSSSFTDTNGSTHDNSQALASTLRKLLEGITIPPAPK